MHVFQDVIIDDQYRFTTDGHKVMLLDNLEPVTSTETAASVLTHVVTDRLHTFDAYPRIAELITTDTDRELKVEELTDDEAGYFQEEISPKVNLSVGAQVKAVLRACFPLAEHYLSNIELIADGFYGSHIQFQGHALHHLHQDLEDFTRTLLGSTRRDAIKSIAQADLAAISWASMFTGLVPEDWCVEYLRNNPSAPDALSRSEVFVHLNTGSRSLEKFQAALGCFKPRRRRALLFNTPDDPEALEHLEQLLMIIKNQDTVHLPHVHTWKDAHFKAIESIDRNDQHVIDLHPAGTDETIHAIIGGTEIDLDDDWQDFLDRHPQVRIPVTYQQYGAASNHLRNCLSAPHYFASTANGEALVFTVVNDTEEPIAACEVGRKHGEPWCIRQASSKRNAKLDADTQERVDKYAGEVIELLKIKHAERKEM